MKLNDLEKKKILILGLGREGIDTFLFLRKKFKNIPLGVADTRELSQFSKEVQAMLTNDKHCTLHLGEGYLEAIKNYQVVIKAPGISPYAIAPFISNTQIITSQTDIFFENCPGTIIGITGTKGKSTTASLCYEVLKAAGKKVHLVGNIEKPVLQYLKDVPLRGISRSETRPNDIFVYELSSFQLTNLKHSPHIAIFLNLYPEHLDYYQGNFEKYANAKANITTHQTNKDFLLYNKNDPSVSKIAARSKAKKIPFSSSILGPTKDFLVGPRIARIVASTEPARLLGELFKIPRTTVETAIKNFAPLPNRLEKVGEHKKILFYNDSLATIPHATIHALELLGSKVHTLIAGGFDRGVNYSPLSKALEGSSVKTLILFPTTGEKILKGMAHPPLHFFANSMEEAVKLCYKHTPEDTICLLSPASSSFNMFKDYKDRGDQFKKFVALYGKKK